MPRLSDLALSSLADCLASHYAPVGSLACVPTREAQLLLQVVAERLSAGDGSDDSDASARATSDGSYVTPPVELLRTFYGGSLERLRQVGATDDWVGETLGSGGLRRLSHLSLSRSHLSAYGVGHIARALPSLRELRLSRCRGLTATSLVEIGQCARLEWLGVTECQLALASASEAEPLARLTKLHSLDLGGNQIGAEVAAALCEHLRARAGGGGSGGGENGKSGGGGGGESGGGGGGGTGPCEPLLRVLRLWGSPLDDRAAAAASALEGLRVLDLGWSRVGGEGLQSVALGLGDSLTELSLAHCGGLQRGDLATCLAAMPQLGCLELAGLELAADDLEQVARLPQLRRLGLEACCLEASSPLAALAALVSCAHLHTLSLEGATLAAVAPAAPPAAPPAADPTGTAGAGTRSVAPLRVLRAGGAAELLGAVPSQPLLRFPWASARRTLHTLELDGCPGAVGALLRECSKGGEGGVGSKGDMGGEGGALPCLLTLGATGGGLDDRVLGAVARACPSLTSLDASDNPAVGDRGVAALVVLRASLRVLRLEHLPRLTPHALPHLAQLDVLQALSLLGTAISTAQQGDALPLHRRAEARQSEAAAARATLDHAQAAAAAAEPPPRYDAAAMRALHDAPFSRCPTKPLPQLPLGQRAARRATTQAKSPGYTSSAPKPSSAGRRRKGT
jgi:hypothetical protein